MSEETTKYQKQWDEYQSDKGKGCTGSLIFLPFFALLIYSFRQYPEYADKIGIAFFIIVAAASFLLNKPKWTCPRCQGIFYGRYKSENIIRAENCIDCGLPIYYGSSYFWNHWGTERGKEQLQQVKEQEKQ